MDFFTVHQQNPRKRHRSKLCQKVVQRLRLKAIWSMQRPYLLCLKKVRCQGLTAENLDLLGHVNR